MKLVTGMSGEQDVLLSSYTADGTLRWSTTWNGPKSDLDRGNALAVAPDGTVYVTGMARWDGAADYRIFLGRFVPGG